MSSPCSTPKSQTCALVALVLGGCLVSTMAVFLRLVERNKKKHPTESIRQLTIWNLFISGMALMAIILFVQSSSPHSCNWLAVIGCAVISLNIFVMIARAILLAFRRNRSAGIWTLDIISHYIWPLLTILLFLLILHRQRGVGGASVASIALKAVMIFIGVLIMWLLLNLILYQVCGTWAYRSNAGMPHTLTLSKWMGLLGMIGASFGLALLGVWGVGIRKPKLRTPRKVLHLSSPHDEATVK